MPVHYNTIFNDPALHKVEGIQVQGDADLSSKTSMATRATASVLANVKHPMGLRNLLKLARERDWPLLVLGGGTNTIFAAKEFDGIVALLDREMFGEVYMPEENVVRVGAACDLTKLMGAMRKFRLMGLEFCTGIPGTVGGALAGNAGAGGWGLCDFVERAVVMTRSGRIVEVRRGDFRYAYRKSELSEAIILEADLLLEPLLEERHRERAQEFASKKKGQPFKAHSCGCMFKNPKDPSTGKPISAGWLIDQAGMKGYSLNSVTVDQGHANFIINRDGNASGEEFLAMISLVRDVIYERYGIELEVEARIVGGPLTSCILR